MTEKNDDKPVAQTQSNEKPQVQADTPPEKPEKPTEPQNIIFRLAKTPDKEPLIHFEKKTSEKKEPE